MRNWQELIFSDDLDFESKVQRVFDYQYEHNTIYRRFCEALNVTPGTFLCHPVRQLGDQGSEAQSQKEQENQGKASHPKIEIDSIPLLPIRAFKDSEVVTVPPDSTFNNLSDRRRVQHSELIFYSSGTGSQKQSKHWVADAGLYRTSLLRGFQQFYTLEESVIWGYTPGYADNPHSSLIWMINELIEEDETGLSRFLPLGKKIDPQELSRVKKSGKKLILFGAAFGLLDLEQLSDVRLPQDSIVIETGGMKTHRREMSRDELHRRLSEGFGIDIQQVHSEYGMAELLSQAYATDGKWFRTVPWMKVSIRNPDDPAEVLPPYREGLIGVIDLVNVHSCSFILTGDKGIQDKNGRFQVLGRWNPKDLRGCNFLIDED